MSILCVFHASSPGLPNKVLTHLDDIANTLAQAGLTFSHTPIELRVRPGGSDAHVLDACRVHLDQLMVRHGSAACRLINRDGVDAAQADLRAEHVIASDEVFAVVTGRALLAVRVEDWVYSVVCEKGDQLLVPAGARRWIELGDNPFCVAVRLTKDEQGAQLAFTGDESARLFAGIDEF